MYQYLLAVVASFLLTLVGFWFGISHLTIISGSLLTLLLIVGIAFVWKMTNEELDY